MSEVITVGIQAEAPRSYHEMAAELFFPDTAIELVRIGTFPALYDAVESKNGQKARFPTGLDYIVAAEQSTAMKRWVHRSTDQLFRPDRNLYVHRRAWLRVPLGLVAASSTLTLERLQNPEEGKKVYVHTQEEALEQCEDALTKLLPNAKKIYENDSAGAVQEIVSGSLNGGYHIAIAGPAAAEANGGFYMGRQLNHQDAATSFMLISRQPAHNPNATKSLIIVTEKEDYPGSLAAIQSAFTGSAEEEDKINLSSINSQPTKTIGRYRFILEAERGMQELSMREAVSTIEAQGHEVRVIGSYDVIELSA